MNLHYLLLEVRIRDNVKMHNYLQLSIILHGGEFNPCIIMAHKAILVGHKIFEIQGSYHIYIFIYIYSTILTCLYHLRISNQLTCTENVCISC